MTLLHVDVALLPPASQITITSAVLYLYKIGSGGSFLINLGRALDAWLETTATWNNSPSFSLIRNDIAFTCSGACWGTIDITSYVYHTWEITDWSAHGLCLYDLIDTGSWYIWASSDGVVSQRPYAMVYYTCP